MLAAVNEKRVASRRRVLKSAFIILSDMAPKLECRNISETGTTLQVFTFGLPLYFDLLID